MSKLDDLVRTFKPRRNFSCSHTTIEVDGVFVRVASDEEKDSWVPMRDTEDIYSMCDPVTHYLIKSEDLLQDPAIIRSARVSTSRDTKEVDEKSQGMVNFLWRDHHVTPSEGSVKFRSKWTTPIMYAQPIFRLFGDHNEFSGRYSILDGGYYTPQLDGFANEELIKKEFSDAERGAQALYQKFLELGVAKEMARYVHLYRFYTKFYYTFSLRHILEFLLIDQNAENRHSTTEFWKIRDVLEELVKNWAPWAFEAHKTNPRPLNFDWIRKAAYNYSASMFEDSLSGRRVNVLDHGYLELIKSSIDSHVIIAALSDFPDPTKALNHGSMTFYVVLPIHVFRQWIRHRSLHLSELEIDFDGVVENNLFYIPERFREQTGKVGHYIFNDMDDSKNSMIRELLSEHIISCKERYLRLRDYGLSQQFASMNLPYVFYIPVILTAPLGGLANFISLRTDSHAQKEIQAYAYLIWQALKDQNPIVAGMFAKYMYYGNSEEIKNFRYGPI